LSDDYEPLALPPDSPSERLALADAAHRSQIEAVVREALSLDRGDIAANLRKSAAELCQRVLKERLPRISASLAAGYPDEAQSLALHGDMACIRTLLETAKSISDE